MKFNSGFKFFWFILFGLLGSFSFAVVIITAIGGWNPEMPLVAWMLQPQYLWKVFWVAMTLFFFSISSFCWMMTEK